MTGGIARRPLGASGLEVGALALGTMMFGRWGNPDRDACRRMVDIALDAGIDLIDTADIYDFGVSEEIVGAAIAGRRDRVVLATKVGNAMSEDPAERGLSRRWILASCDASLRRLGVDHIDVYQMHRPDPDTPLEESLAAYDELVRAGKVGADRHVDLRRPPSSTSCSASPPTTGGSARRVSSRPTACSCGASSRRSFPPAGGTGSACWCGRP